MNPNRSPITTHVLDLNLGIAAAHLPVTLEILSSGNQWKKLAQGETTVDGRIETLLPVGSKATPGNYRLTFDTSAYFTSKGISTSFYPSITVSFQLSNPDQHHHIPLLLSPYGYSTYKGT